MRASWRARRRSRACASSTTQPEHEEAIAAWRERPGKVCLRARTNAQWEQVSAEPHTLAGQADGEAVVALPPRRRSERGPLLERLQAMSSALEPPPEDAPELPGAVTYALNPAAAMSSGKTVAQIAHAAVMAADTGELEDWVAAGCPGQVIAPGPERFAALAAAGGLRRARGRRRPDRSRARDSHRPGPRLCFLAQVGIGGAHRSGRSGRLRPRCRLTKAGSESSSGIQNWMTR